MATKIRRSLFIGLGGTGMRTLIHLKKLFIETYGEVPNMIGFLGVDTDRGEYAKSQELKNTSSLGHYENSDIYIEGKQKESIVRLDPSEQIQITVNNPYDLYMRRKENYKFVPPENVYALKALMNGAGQVRSNGRFAFIVNSKIIEKKLNAALTKVAQATNITDKYELITNTTDVYLIFSLGGGTGCGTFLDMAYLIRRSQGSTCKLAAYAMLPEVFHAQMTNGIGRVRSNAYGAIKDMDWLMSRDWNNKAVTIPLQDGGSWNTNMSPFDACIFVDNKNRNLDVYNETSQIEEMMALSLITSVGELSTANVSVLDNIAVDTAGGEFNIEGKKAWVSGMGICEVIIHTEELRKIYSHQAVIHLINKLLNHPTDISKEVANWIDSAKIKEHDADDVIDYLLELEICPLSGIDKSDLGDAEPVVMSYVSSQQVDAEKFEKQLQALIVRVSSELRNAIIGSINRIEGKGIGATADFLNGLESQINIYLKEMQDELTDYKKLEEQYNQVIHSLCNSLKEIAASFFGWGLDGTKEDLCSKATEFARIKLEILRRKYAITFFVDLLNKVGSYKVKVKEIHDRLEVVKNQSINEISRLKQEISRNTETFQINLTSVLENSLKFKDKEIVFSDFLVSLAEGNKVFDFGDLEVANIGVKFYQFAYNLDEAKRQGNMDINEVLRLLPPKELELLVRNMTAKSSPLLLHNFLGYTNDEPAVNYYIGVNGFEDSLLKKDDYFKKNLQTFGDVQFSNIGMRDRIIVFSQMNPIPPFAINSVSSTSKSEYEDPKQTICFHFDQNLLQEMKRTNFSIEPGFSDNTLNLWVKGFIFGLIKNEAGMYKYLDEENGDCLSNYWMNLASERDESFGKFREIKGSVEAQYMRKIHELEANHGQAHIIIMYEKAKKDYLLEFSGIEYSNEDLVNDPKLKNIAELIRKEVDVAKNLQM